MCARPVRFEAFTAAAADLQAFSGTWAYTAANCSAYLHDRIGNEARKRGAGLTIIRPTEIEWVTPASCEVANLRAAGARWDMDGKCEIKGRDFTADITLTGSGALAHQPWHQGGRIRQRDAHVRALQHGDRVAGELSR